MSADAGGGSGCGEYRADVEVGWILKDGILVEGEICFGECAGVGLDVGKEGAAALALLVGRGLAEVDFDNGEGGSGGGETGHSSYCGVDGGFGFEDQGCGDVD